MEALATIGLVSNVIGFLDTATTLCKLIKECLSTAGAPAEVLAISKRLDLAINTIKELDDAGSAQLGHEKLALQICSGAAEDLRLFLDSLKIAPTKTLEVEGSSNWLSKKKAAASSNVEKGWRAFKALRGKEKLNTLQTSLDRILDLIMMQQQSRVEASTSRVDEKTTVLLQNSKSILRGLRDLQLIANKSPVDLSAIRTKIIYIIPSARNLEFVGRDDAILQLDQRLLSPSQPGNHTKRVQTAGLYGLGGIGKSQIALEYAYRKRDQNPDLSIFWVLASSLMRFEGSYKRIATEFQLPGWTDPQVDILELVRNWLEGQYQRPWLMIVDNVDDTQIFSKMPSGKSPSEYLPQVADGSIIFTSRNKDISLDLVRDPISVEPLSSEEARKLLSERTQTIRSDTEMDMLLTELDHLPLAITQAASYMMKRNKTVYQYLKLFRDSEASRIKLLGHKFVDTGREAKSLESVATTWLMSFEKIMSENSRAGNLLFLMCFMDRQCIPKALVTTPDEDLLDFEEAIGILQAYSFISVDSSGANYSMHRLVQTVTRAWLSGHDNELVVQCQALDSLSSNFPNGEFETWETCALYLPHAESVLSRTAGIQFNTQKTNRSELLKNIAWYLKQQGKYDFARAKLEESLEIYSVSGTAGCAEALNVKRKLASVVEQQGHREDAIKLFQEVLESQERLHGMDHLETLETVDKLAMALANTLLPERWAESEDLARRGLQGRQAVLGENDLKVAESLQTIGWVLYREGKYSQSEKPLRECLEKCKMILGEGHPETIWAAHDLAITLFNTSSSEYEEAESLLRHSASLTASIFGRDHPNSIVIQTNLGRALSERGKHDDVESMQRDQLALSERILGQNHSTTIWCTIAVAESLFYQTKYHAAQSFIQQELEKRQQSVQIAQNMVDILILFNILGCVCEELGSLEEARSHFEFILLGGEKVLGKENPAILQAGHCLARVLLAQGKYSDAEKILGELIPQEIRIRGEMHEETILSGRLMGIAMFGLRDFAAAEIWFRKLLNTREKTLGHDHEYTLSARDNFEAALTEQSKWEECEKSCRQSLEVRERLAPDDFNTLRTMSNLMLILEQQGNCESEAIYDRLLEKIKNMAPDFMEGQSYRKKMTCEEDWYFRRIRNGSFDLETLKARLRVASWYDAQSNFDRAAEIYDEVVTNMELTFGKDFEATKLANEVFAKFLNRRGRIEEAGPIRRSAEDSII